MKSRLALSVTALAITALALSGCAQAKDAAQGAADSAASAAASSASKASTDFARKRLCSYVKAGQPSGSEAAALRDAATKAEKAGVSAELIAQARAVASPGASVSQAKIDKLKQECAAE